MTTDHKYNAVWSRSPGFTMVELLVVMALFMVVIMISTSAFDNILSGAKQQMASSESNIQGIVGLEMMRWDLENTGYGLPRKLRFTAEFEESTQAADSLAKGIDPTDFNDNNISTAINPDRVPRPIQSGSASGAADWENGRDYIVIKSAAVGTDAAAKRWNYIGGESPNAFINEVGSDDVLVNDRVITMSADTRELRSVSATDFSYAVPARTGGKLVPPAAYQPGVSADMDSGKVYLVYGIEAWADTTSTLRVPYNRVDYYIRRPAASKDISTRCAPGTGILYKGNMIHSGTDAGKVTQYPLYDCVADMQVVYGLDTNGDGGIDSYVETDTDPTLNVLQLMSAKQIYDRLKQVRVYLLTHEGQKDRLFTYAGGPSVRVGENLLGVDRGREYDLSKLQNIGDSWKNYRWKLYTIVVNPKNINF